jgi:hypothetical protein
MSDTLTQVAIVYDHREYVCWIPSHFAVKGKVVSIDDVMTNGVVNHVYSTMKYKEARVRSTDHAKQRKASDI